MVRWCVGSGLLRQIFRSDQSNGCQVTFDTHVTGYIACRPSLVGYNTPRVSLDG